MENDIEHSVAVREYSGGQSRPGPFPSEGEARTHAARDAEWDARDGCGGEGPRPLPSRDPCPEMDTVVPGDLRDPSDDVTRERRRTPVAAAGAVGVVRGLPPTRPAPSRATEPGSLAGGNPECNSTVTREKPLAKNPRLGTFILRDGRCSLTSDLAGPLPDGQSVSVRVCDGPGFAGPGKSHRRRRRPRPPAAAPLHPYPPQERMSHEVSGRGRLSRRDGSHRRRPGPLGRHLSPLPAEGHPEAPEAPGVRDTAERDGGHPHPVPDGRGPVSGRPYDSRRMARFLLLVFVVYFVAHACASGGGLS